MAEYQPDEAFALTPLGFEKLHSGDVDDLTDEQLLILRFADGLEAREQGEATMEQIHALLSWYQEVTIGVSLVEMIITGEVYVDIAEDGEPVFSLSSEGKLLAESIGFELDFE